jgi:dihydropteroate synthase type 2
MNDGSTAMRSPKLLGIVNITADSFSDGGRFLAPDAAIAHGRTLLEQGADILDLGPASSHPDAAIVTSEEEIKRITPVIDALGRDASISIDSYQTKTQAYALDRNVAYLNDIQGFSDPGFYPRLADADAKLIIMHSVQNAGPATRARVEPHEIWSRIETFFDARIADLEKSGIARKRLIIDPGMGFFLGSSPDASVAVLKDLRRLARRYDLPVLVSVAKKSLLRALTGRKLAEIGPANLAAELGAVSQGVDYIRTHDVGDLADALTIWRALGLTPSAS